MQTHANEAMYDGGSRGWSPSCTCFIISIFSNGTWLTREPPCRIFFQTVSNQTQTLSFPFDVTSLPARFSQSVRREPFRIFSDLVIIPFLSGLIEVLLHERCIPHQNSQCLFWASVCVCQSCVCVRVCLRVYIYICVNMFLCLCLCLSAYQHICVCLYFSHLLYSIPCLSLATKTLTSSHLLILTSSQFLTNIFMSVFGVCKSYNFITHLSTCTPTRSRANCRLVFSHDEENPTNSAPRCIWSSPCPNDFPKPWSAAFLETFRWSASWRTEDGCVTL